MKKIVVIILAIIYAATSSGAVLTMHYCMGKLSSVDFSQNTACSKCGMKHEKNCCEQKSKWLKAQDNHEAFVQLFSLDSPVALIYTDFTVSNNRAFAVSKAISVNNNSPPFSTPSICILHCVFRI